MGANIKKLNVHSLLDHRRCQGRLILPAVANKRLQNAFKKASYSVQIPRIIEDLRKQ